MVLPESPRTRGAEGATRPETLRHPNGRNRATLGSGPRGPTEGERKRYRAGTQSLRFQDRGAADPGVRRLFYCRPKLAGLLMGRRTPLHELHVAAGARMVDFGGWDMPVGYGSQIEEHHAVRRDAGMFDVSHMCTVDLRGAGVRPLLQRLLANDVGRLTAPGKALYSCMLRPEGGVIDDLIAYFIDERWFRLVVYAGTADKDLAWIRDHAKPVGVAAVPRRDLAIIAVQGPNARAKATP